MGGDTENINSFTAINSYAFLKIALGIKVESYEVKSRTLPVAASAVI